MSARAALGLEIPNLLPDSIFGVGLDWLQPAGRLIWASLFVIAATVVIIIWAKTPRRPEPITWAAAMGAAVAVYGLMIVGYGTLPHEWITFANSYLNWGKDSFLVEQSSVVPFNITMRVVTDMIATLIYVVVATINIYLFVIWQKRPVREAVSETSEDAAESERTQTRTSAYGRPVTAN